MQIVGVSADPPAANKDFAKKFMFTFPLLSDERRTIPTALAIKEGRWAVLLNSAG